MSDPSKKVLVASDHAGYRLKVEVVDVARKLGWDVEDLGTNSESSCDYPDFVIPAAEAVASGRCERGFVFGGSGNGEAMAANKVRGIRAAVVTDAFTAEMARRHNDAQVASFGTRVVPEERILELAGIFLATPFDGGRHEPRVKKIAAYEEKRAR